MNLNRTDDRRISIRELGIKPILFFILVIHTTRITHAGKQKQSTLLLHHESHNFVAPSYPRDNTINYLRGLRKMFRPGYDQLKIPHEETPTRRTKKCTISKCKENKGSDSNVNAKNGSTNEATADNSSNYDTNNNDIADDSITNDDITDDSIKNDDITDDSIENDDITDTYVQNASSNNNYDELSGTNDGKVMSGTSTISQAYKHQRLLAWVMIMSTIFVGLVFATIALRISLVR